MPLPHERPSRNYMRELKAVARAAGDLADHLGKVNLLPAGFPIEQVEGFCLALTSLPHGTAEGSIAPLRAADSELNRVRQHYIPTYDEDEDEKEPLVSRGDDFDQRLVGLMAAIRAAIEQYKLESGEELDTDVTPDLADVDKANDAIIAALEATTKAGTDINQIDQAISEFDTEQLEFIELEVMLASDAGVQVRSAEAALKTEKPRPTVIGWLSEGVDKTTKVLEHQLSKQGEKAAQVGQEFGSMVGELLEINFPKIVKSLKVAKTHLSKIVVILSGDDQEEPPSDFDYVEVYNMLLRGEKVPDYWAPFVTHIDFFFENENHHLKGNLREITVDTVFEFQEVSILSNLTNLRYLDLYGSVVVNLMPINMLRKLEVLDLTGVDILSLEPISSMTSLRILKLTGSKIHELHPIVELVNLEFLELEDTDISDITALHKLTNMRRLSLDNTYVEDLSPVSNMTNLLSLHVDNTEISDLTPLAKLTKLKTLSLKNIKTTDLSPLAHLLELRSLFIDKDEESQENLLVLSHLKKLDIIAS